MLAIGMTYDVFWYEDLDMTDIYIKAFKRKQSLGNFDAWLGGYYAYIATSKALANGFRGKGQQAVGYLEKPLELITDKKKVLSDSEIAYHKFKPLIEHFNSKRKKG
jgi:hypothetical protein